MTDDRGLTDRIIEVDRDVRYVAIYRDALTMASREGTADASRTESDRYEELLVNPTLLKLATQRGDIDCGGLDYLLIRYGNFFQFVQPTSWGHLSVCIEAGDAATTVVERIQEQLDDELS